MLNPFWLDDVATVRFIGERVYCPAVVIPPEFGRKPMFGLQIARNCMNVTNALRVFGFVLFEKEVDCQNVTFCPPPGVWATFR